VPVRAMVWGELAALSAIEMEPARDPVAVGSKVTEMVQFALTARVAPQVLVWAKLEALAPPTVMPVKVMVPLPVLVRVTVWAALVVPTTCWAVKARDEAERPTAPAVPVPVSGMVCGDVEAESTKAIEAESAPDVLGTKVAEMMQVAAAARVDPQVFDSVKLEALVPPSVMLVRPRVYPPELVRVKV